MDDPSDINRLADLLAKRKSSTDPGLSVSEFEMLYAQMPHIEGDPPLYRYWLEADWLLGKEGPVQ